MTNEEQQKAIYILDRLQKHYDIQDKKYEIVISVLEKLPILIKAYKDKLPEEFISEFCVINIDAIEKIRRLNKEEES